MSRSQKFRLRVSHDFLAKDGWRFDTTVEIEVTREEASDPALLTRLRELVREVGVIGEAEKQDRNAKAVQP